MAQVINFFILSDFILFIFGQMMAKIFQNILAIIGYLFVIPHYFFSLYWESLWILFGGILLDPFHFWLFLCQQITKCKIFVLSNVLSCLCRISVNICSCPLPDFYVFYLLFLEPNDLVVFRNLFASMLLRTWSISLEKHWLLFFFYFRDTSRT
jgi:hypothetical protein